MQTELEGPKNRPQPAGTEEKSAETADTKTKGPGKEEEVEEGWGGDPRDDDSDDGGD